jgi:hypothetical protein
VSALFGVDAYTVIGDAESDVITVRPDSDFNPFAVPVLDGIRDKIGHDLLVAQTIAAARDGGEIRHELSLGELLPKPVQNGANDCCEVDVLGLEVEAPRTDSADVE